MFFLVVLLFGQISSQDSPDFLQYRPIRQTNFQYKILNDLESHVQPNHQYRDNDLITWTHELNHYVNSNIRRNYSGYNGFYLLEDRAILIKEPPLTIFQVAQSIPQELRGFSYNLYLRQSRAWNDTPLYLLDEWICYTNGSLMRLEGRISNRGETVLQMLEFNTYVLYLLWLTESTSYDNKDLAKLFFWNFDRTIDIYDKSNNISSSHLYLDKFRNNTQLRDYFLYKRNLR